MSRSLASARIGLALVATSLGIGCGESNQTDGTASNPDDVETVQSALLGDSGCRTYPATLTGDSDAIWKKIPVPAISGGTSWVWSHSPDATYDECLVGAWQGYIFRGTVSPTQTWRPQTIAAYIPNVRRPQNTCTVGKGCCANAQVTGWYSSIDYCTQFGCATSWHDWFSWSNATHPCADDATQCCIDAGVMHTLPASGVMEVRTAASLAGAVPGERSLPTFTTYLGAN